MSLTNFLMLFMPYCLRRQADGSYMVLNREYRPLGFFPEGRHDPDDHPVAVHIDGLSSTLAAKISCRGDLNTDEIYLYGPQYPTDSRADLKLYFDRLKLLATLKISKPIGSASDRNSEISSSGEPTTSCGLSGSEGSLKPCDDKQSSMASLKE
jgi:hypothetical protein